jgi:hypothetical protein
MYKSKRVGRPKAEIATEQVAVRLPVVMIEALSPQISKSIRERLARSLSDDMRDQRLARLQGQIEQIAKDVRGATGHEWHTDRQAHLIFIEALKLLFDDLPVPAQQVSDDLGDVRTAAKILYQRYAATVRELEQHGRTEMRTTTRSLIKGEK